MAAPDIINALFESLGSLFVCNNILVLHKDKMVRGVSKLTMAFFMGWGIWNCWYYPYLNQWFSFGAGICLALANLVWVSQMIYYTYKK